MGRPFRIEGLPGGPSKWLQRQWNRPYLHASSIDYRVVVRSGQLALSPDSARMVTLPSPEGELVVFATPHGFTFLEGNDGVRCIHGPEGTEMQVTCQPRPTIRLLRAVQLGITEGLRRSGLLPLHASAAQDAAGVQAFLGPSGRGKSTTVLHAIQRGWRLVCEDTMWCDPETLRVWGIDDALRLLPDSLGKLGVAIDSSWSVGSDGKTEVPFAALPISAQPTGTLTRVSVLRRDPAAMTGYSPLSSREAVLALWDAIGLPLSPETGHATSGYIARVVRSVELSTLVLGKTPLHF
ncbi:hypothetical protein DES52_10217 [Deinococcus yavapaiensis KR-236]|uniref:Hpr(Ser) kinase/phosphatase n=1 Tax=Deinococcus yavapaiensis KR-236 TaxID=694435 RepID=A0A318SBB6_9DEIO|nr:hypothetical protein DES52_10217 [Deinococcus yavapaiensis KR-236]